MLDTKDIELLQNIIVTTMNQQFSEQDKKWETILDQRFAESENLVLEELDRVETRLTRRMDKMQDNLDDLNRLCRILLLEKGNYELLERRVATLESRVYPQ